MDDRSFSSHAFKLISQNTKVWPPRVSFQQLCDRCEGMDLLASDFVRHDSVAALMERDCKLCHLFYNSICKHWDQWSDPNIHFFLVGSAFRMDPKGPPVLSIYGHPGMVKSQASSSHI